MDMLEFYNSRNHPIKLFKQLGRGGEGTVYTCEGDTLVGKIYQEPISEEKAGKLLWMMQHKNEQLLKTTAWIDEVLKDKPDGKVVGFLMPKIKAKEIHELYSPKSRRIYFPDATWYFLVHTAANLARAFHNLHKDGHVMGDVNQGNCVITADGTVKLIDCDSYGIKTETRRYPCEVGVVTHVPPELQGKNLRNIERTENQDNFGLAIIIFQLLFLGRHPFAGNYLGAKDKSLEDAIREHLFVYGKNAASKNIVQPPGTLSLSNVSPQVAALFEDAFDNDAGRPKPRQWVEALEALAENLEQCTLNPGHIFYSKLTLCPWCKIEEETGLTLFPFTVASNALSKKYERNFSIQTVENIIANLNLNSIPLKISDAAKPIRVHPKREFIEERKPSTKKLLLRRRQACCI